MALENIQCPMYTAICGRKYLIFRPKYVTDNVAVYSTL